MPLRSVEAGTREDAIAAAREQFGPDAQVVGVRRVRSGGVLGFFATERYVARVAPDPFPRPGAPATARSAAPATASFGSPLSSAPPARARTTAPARNAAAAWAAEASRGTTPRPAVRAARRDDDERVDELVGLLDAAPAAPVRARPERGTPAAVRAPSPRARHDEDGDRPFSPAGSRRATREPEVLADEFRADGAGAATSGRHRAPTSAATPSPFTAALARMVAGDREVSQAVAQALEEPAAPASEPARVQVGGAPSAGTPEAAAPRMSLAEAMRSAHASMRSQAAQEDRVPVRDEAPAPIPPATTTPVAPTPPADPGQPGTPVVSARQEEIAEALRTALGQGSSDEALAGILRTMLDGYSPAAAVAELPLDRPPIAAPVAEPEAVSAAAATELDDVPVEARAVSEVAPLLARTASDPAPMAMAFDATTVMPRVSLLPPLPGSRGRGLPPVPPSSRLESRPGVPPAAEYRPEEPQVTSGPAPAGARPATRALATVTRLPVGPFLADGAELDGDELDGDELDGVGPDVVGLAGDAPEVPTEPAAAHRDAAAIAAATQVVARLVELGVPQELLGDDAATRIREDGLYGTLTRVLGDRLPEAPGLPREAGDVLLVVGPGAETLHAARSLAGSMRLDPDRVQWATRGDLARLAPKSSRLTTVDAAADRREEMSSSATVTVVAVDVPLGGDVYWMAQMLAVWSPVAVWAVVEATRKPEPVERWLEGLARVDAVMVQDTELSADPAAVLDRLTVPVALLDGVRATPHRWASVLCERLDVPQA